MKSSIIISTTLALSLPNAMASPSAIPSTFQPQLAKEFQEGIHTDWSNYLYSEKLDGIRAIWDGEKLLTRAGNLIAAPTWFTQRLPNVALEGELWAGRGLFEHTMSVVMDDYPEDEAWRSIRFMVFDLPYHVGEFESRYQALRALVIDLNADQLGYIPHYPAISENRIYALLQETDRNGGEGLMLRHRKQVYLQGRSDAMIKMKISQDAEAEVIGYVNGKGKHRGRMGSLIVKLADGKTFKIGTGFSDQQRENPPPLGAMVTYRHNGFTKNGIPKFARFVRVDITKQ
ncbi:DNA ligase [Enterovibrio sp. ZSDZ35]|uniref:DNA ligase n=1 Tax=Enterovibrio qingdaonensis TaxID=2899818 RepID=A0ABT5QJJ3_9GAMM|nr:DNA ligase [Enterovibrio sp. ZSDZ35]MDD1780779.1 DNA ligase [Enterovibrio sp. ZSDZ35]